MSLYIDTNVVQAEIDRRYELAGVDRHAPTTTTGTGTTCRCARSPHTRWPRSSPVWWAARRTPSEASRRAAGQVDTGRPRHL